MTCAWVSERGPCPREVVLKNDDLCYYHRKVDGGLIKPTEPGKVSP